MDRILQYIKVVRSVMVVGLVISGASLFAQNQAEVKQASKSISGTIRSDNEAVPGATVVEKGTNNGTVTDANGKFSLSVADGATLLVSFIGLKSQEIAVGNQTSFDITMEADVTVLQDVVVVGYGTAERKDLTTSVSSISSKQLTDIPINSAGQALAGRLAGVQVITTEGSPNAQVQIRVRGGGSITQDNTPLYVVDGVQVENALNVIAPQDIQSIDVLKDASATAIYGARGANGVVIITTKGGKAQKLTVNYSGFFGMRQLANKLDVMKPYDFVNYQYERSRGSTATENTFRNTYGNYTDLELYKGVPFVDWQKESFGRTALQQTHNISLNGGTAKTSVALSLTANQEEGVQLNSDFNRFVGNLRVDHKFNKYVKAGTTIRYNYSVINGAGTSSTGSSSTNRLRQSIKYRPFLFPGQNVDTYDPNYAAETNANSLSLVNPVLLATQEYQKDIQTTANFSGYVVVDPTPYLSFRSTIGYDIFNEQNRVFSDSITNNAKQNGQGFPIASIDSTRRTILNNSNVITFTLNKLLEGFAKKNKLDFMVGEETYQTNTKSRYHESHAYPLFTPAVTALNNMNTIGTPFTVSGRPNTEINTTLLSFFSRASFSRDDKYMAVLTMRADGSSKFAEGHQWGYFPSASLAWRISGENFFTGIRNKVNDLKLRVSMGQSGNNRINDFLYLSQFQLTAPYSTNNTQTLGYVPSSLANENLKWETTISRNIGIDIGLWESRLQLSVDVYNNSVNDLLVSTPVPTSSGYSTQLQNVGSTSNHGVEFQLSGTPIQNQDFNWKATFNMSFNTNKIESLGRQTSFLVSSNWAGSNVPSDYSVAVGQPTGTIWGLVSDGYYQVDDFDYNATTKAYTLKAGIASNTQITSVAPRPGVIKFKDVNGDGVVNDNDRTTLGSANPTFFGGFNNQFSYKNFDLSVFLNFQYGNKVLNANKLENSSGYTINSNILTTMNGRFRNVDTEGNVVTDPDALKALNANATIWSPLTTASSFYVNSWAVEDGSFIRINNVTLGYTLPNKLIQKIKIQKLRIYTTVNNLAVFTNYSGYDPDVNTRRASPMTPGVDYSAYPRSHLYIFGLNLTF